MKQQFLTIFFIILVIPSLVLGYSFFVLDASQKQIPEFFVGIDVAYDNLEEIKKLIGGNVIEFLERAW